MRFHIELPRVFGRVPFVASSGDGLEIGIGQHAILINLWHVECSWK